jgi:hypothetical protein
MVWAFAKQRCVLFETQHMVRGAVSHKMFVKREVNLKAGCGGSSLPGGPAAELNAGHILVIIEASEISVPVKIQCRSRKEGGLVVLVVACGSHCSFDFDNTTKVC